MSQEEQQNVNAEETSFVDAVLGGENHSPAAEEEELINTADTQTEEDEAWSPDDGGEDIFADGDDSDSKDESPAAEEKEKAEKNPPAAPDSAALKQEIEALQKRLHDTQSAFHKATGERSRLQKELEELKANKENDDDWFSEGDNERVAELESAVKRSDEEIARIETESKDLESKKAVTEWDAAAAPVIREHPDFEEVMYGKFVPLLDPQTGNASIRKEWEALSDKSPASQYKFAKRMLDSLEFQRDPDAYKERMRQSFNHEKQQAANDDDGSAPVGKEGLDFLQSAEMPSTQDDDGRGSFVDAVFGK